MKTKLQYAILIIVITVLVALAFLGAYASKRPPSMELTGYSPLLAPTRDKMQPLSITPTPKPTQSAPGNMLSNSSFEGDYVNCGASCNVAPLWTAYSAPSNPPPCIAGTPGCDIVCPTNCLDCDPDHIDYGCWWCKPEHKAATLQFPERVNTGSSAQQAFCYGRQCRGGVYQSVPAVIGARLQLSAWVENWQCADNDGCGGMSDDPATGYMQARIGIDPTGGTDYTSTNIVWSDTNEGRDSYELITIETIAQVQQVTVFLEGSPSWPWAHMHNNWYYDDAALVTLPPLSEHNYLPIVARNYNAPTPTAPPLPPTPTPGPTPTATLYALAWFEPSQVSVTATDTYTVELYVYTSERLGDIELVMASFIFTGIQIISVTPGNYFDSIVQFTVNTDGGFLTIDTLGYSPAGRSRPVALLTLRGRGAIMPLTDYSTFIGTATGGGVTPETKGLEAR